VNGYHLQATNGIFGHLCDYLMDEESWTIRELVIKTGHRLTGPEVQIPAKLANRISYEDSPVFVDMTWAAIERSAAQSLAPAV